MKLKKIRYGSLSAHHQGTFNYLQICAKLAEYGFVAQARSFDSQGSEFLAVHMLTRKVIWVQPATCLSFWKKLHGMGVYVVIYTRGKFYFYPHDKLYKEIKAVSNFERTRAFKNRGRYVFVGMAARLKPILEKYRLGESGPEIINTRRIKNELKAVSYFVDEMEASPRAKRRLNELLDGAWGAVNSVEEPNSLDWPGDPKEKVLGRNLRKRK